MPRPRLIVLTGPSHGGKSSVARGLVQALDGPKAWVAIDPIVETLALVPRDRWAEAWEVGLPVAYDVAEASVSILLEREITVMLESTLTFIPIDGRPPEFHADRLERFLALAARLGAEAHVFRVTAALDELVRRRALTGRLTDGVVEGTWRQHGGTPIDGAVEVDTTAVDAGAATQRVAAALAAAASTP